MHRLPDHPLPEGKQFDVEKVRADFPLLSTTTYGKPLVYLDNGATTQKPLAVIERVSRYYWYENANIHRGVYKLSQDATLAYEEARKKVQRFLNAADEREIIFTRGTTESINLIAASYARRYLNPGDEVIVSHLEHHSNIVPWQIACESAGASLRVIPINDAGELMLDEYAKLLSDRTRIVSVNHVSNSLGTINDVKTITTMAHRMGAMVVIDGAQHVAHFPTDVRAIDADFYAFSGHKLFGPTGIGVLYGKRELLEAMPPFMGGGDMIESVTFEKTTYAQLPNKFEAGTPDIAGAVGLGAAIDYVTGIGFDAFHDHEQDLILYATQRLLGVPGVRIIGTAKKKAGVVSFVVEDPPISALDLGTQFDREGIAVRTGHHCCMPVMRRFNIPATTRVSLAFYNTREDIDQLVHVLGKIRSEAKAVAPLPSQAGAAELRFPDPAAPTPSAAADELADVFDFLEDDQSKTQYILELGEKIPPVPAHLKTDETRVHGCMSVVHLFGVKRPGTPDTLDFIATSDAQIVRGLIAILEKLYAGQRASDVLAFSHEDFFRRIGLERFITVQRRNGLAGMVQRIRAIARAIGQPPAAPAPAMSTKP